MRSSYLLNTKYYMKQMIIAMELVIVIVVVVVSGVIVVIVVGVVIAIDLVLEVDVINILQRHFTVIETGVCWPSLHSGIILISIWRLHSGSGSSLLTFPPALHYFHHSKSGPKSLERIHTAIAFPKLRIPVSREGCRTEIHVVLRSGR